jgi:RNA polymerase sigma-70 factor (ECF subfamily)
LHPNGRLGASKQHTFETETALDLTVVHRIAGLLIPLAGIALPVIIVFVVLHFRERQRQQLYETVMHFADRGLPVPRELLDPPRPQRPSVLATPRFWAFTLIGAGLGLALMFWSLDLAPQMGIGGLLGCIGLAQLAARAPMAEGLAGASLSSFEALVREHQSRVRQQLRRLTRGDVGLADDLAQETFVQAWRHIGSYRGEARLSTWLHRIALNTWLMHRRSAREAEPLETDAVGSVDPSAATLRRIDVERALQALPEAERLALIHCFQLDLSHAEAADVLGWPLGTLKSHVARGKARLRERLAAWQPDSGVTT